MGQLPNEQPVQKRVWIGKVKLRDVCLAKARQLRKAGSPGDSLRATILASIQRKIRKMGPNSTTKISILCERDA